MGDLQKFMDSISANKELKSSIYVLSFLKCKDVKQFTKMKKDFEKKLSPTSNFRKHPIKKMKSITLKGISNVSGTIVSKVNPILKSYANNLDNLQISLKEKNSQ
jgi:hypothetical protein